METIQLKWGNKSLIHGHDKYIFFVHVTFGTPYIQVSAENSNVAQNARFLLTIRYWEAQILTIDFFKTAELPADPADMMNTNSEKTTWEYERLWEKISL